MEARLVSAVGRISYTSFSSSLFVVSFPSGSLLSLLHFCSYLDTEHLQWLRSHLISSPSSSSFLPSSYLLISPSSFPCLCFPSPLSLPLLQLSSFPLFIFLLPTLFIVHTLKAISICHIQSRFMTLSILYILQCILSSLHTPSTCTRKESNYYKVFYPLFDILPSGNFVDSLLSYYIVA